jgi:hypothetical protein
MHIGRLVSHPCGAKTVGRCTQCGSLFCGAHLVDSGDPLCVQCAGRYTPPDAPVRVTREEMLAFDNDDYAAFDAPGDGPLDVIDARDS